MVLPEFDYSVAATLEEACKMQAEWGASAKVMAGGTDIVPPMKDGALKADHIISIARIPATPTRSTCRGALASRPGRSRSWSRPAPTCHTRRPRTSSQGTARA